MKTLALGAVFAGMWLVVGSGPADTLTSPTAAHEAGAVFAASAASVADANEPAGPLDVAPAALTEVVQQYCVVCHNDALLTGNLSLQAFAVENASDRAEDAEKMIRKLRAGMMPPPGIPRPSPDTLLSLVQTLESVVDEAASSAPNLGERRFPRLSNVEYQRAIKDLLDLDVDAGQWLPPDVLMGSFDNMSAAQALTTTLLDSYVRAAIEVTRLAIGNSDAVSSTTIHRNPAEVSQHAWDRVDGTPFGTRGGMVVTHDFPADGDYVFAASTTFGSGNNTWFEDLDISIDGEPVAILKLKHNGGSTSGGGGANNNFALDAEGDVQTDPIFVRAGQHQVSAAFVDIVDGPYEDRFRPVGLSSAAGAGQGYGTTGLTHLTELVVSGPDNVSGVSETASRQKVFTCRPAAGSEERPCAESILTAFATQAYRRPVTSVDVASLINFYDEGAAGAGFEAGVAAGLQAVLVSPEFLFRLERIPEGATAGQVYSVSDVDLATRLSFFLWDAAPDEELLDVAASGRLSDSSVLEQQVDRMLQDPRSEALATRFAHLWLRLQDVPRVQPEAYFYPNYSAQLSDAMVRETELLVQYLVQEDRSLLELFSADYTFLNERLAQHYGIEGILGEEFRRVSYPNDQRRGILGHASVLKLTSMADRTSPVLRGKWVMEVLMGTPPPPPPPNVPAFEASPQAAGGRRLTTRERMEAHSAAPVCASCHDFIDPIGLALDHFDATGQLRIRENMAPLDTRGTFYDGTPISTSSELVGALLQRPIPLVRNFTENLLAYAIGRPTQYFDQPTIRAVVGAAEANDYKLSSLVMGIVQSDVFQKRQVQTTAN